MRVFLVIISILSIVLAGFSITPTPSSWIDKVDPWVLQTAESGVTEFLLFLASQADLSDADLLPTKLEKGRYVYQALTSTAEQSQGPVIADLESLGVEYHPYWVANMIWVRADMAAILQLAGRPDVAHLYANPYVTLDEPVSQLTSISAPAAIEWNISWVGAPSLWAMGFTGQGAVVGGQDTGYIWDHPALKNTYRGWDGTQVNHDYNWFDATVEHSLVPVDPNGHGTHTMGTMVGDDGVGNQIGMAPGARWIGCRNMNAAGVGSPATYAACYQWFLAPTRVDGTVPNSDLAPDVINNSWSCPPSEGCTQPDVLQLAVHNLVTAGIVTSHSAGNSGSGCGTINAPAAIYADSFTVGATGYLTDTIASFSSRGPVTVDYSYRPKPDISAPGVAVRSASPPVGYSVMTGTSMAAPHVAGLVALLISAYPELRGQVGQIEHIIESSALHVPWTGCDSSGVPNNAYGWGRIDALAAYAQAQSLLIKKVASDTSVEPGGFLAYTLTVTHTVGSIPTTNLVLTDTIPTGTTFITATSPYSRTAETVRWDFPSLDAQGTISVEMVVQVDPAATGALVNADYAVHSDQVLPISGLPVITLLTKLYFAPIILNSPAP